MTSDLTGRTAVITGGSRGIGRAAAVALAQGGARVFTGDLHPRDENGELFGSLGITELTCDVRREADVRQLVERAVQATGGLHILVSNAGINLAGQVPDLAAKDWDDCFDTNLRAAFLLSKHAIPRLRAAGGGSVVFMASNAGLLPRAHDPAYSTSKAALIALARSLALCHAADRIRFNAVCPGPVSATGLIDDAILAAADPQGGDRLVYRGQPPGPSVRTHDHPRGSRRGSHLPGQRRGGLGHRHGPSDRWRQILGSSGKRVSQNIAMQLACFRKSGLS